MIMQTMKTIKTAWLFAALSIAGWATTQAQTVWINTAGGDWNTAANWNPTLVPIETTNAIITNSTAFTVTYTAPMSATSIGSLQLGGAGAGEILTLTASGFNVAGSTTVNASSTLNVNAGAVMTNSTLNQAIQTSAVNVNGGTMTNATTQVSNNGSNDGGPLKINSGTVSLGNVTLRRSGATLFSSGLTIFNGTVSANNISIGAGGAANSYNNMSVGGGTLDIAGNLVLGNSSSVTAGRAYQYMQTNGTVTCHGVVTTGVQGANQLDWFTVNQSGVFNATGIVIFTNPVAATANFTNGGTIYLGSGGIFLTNTASPTTNTVSLNDQGLFGATADWTANADMTLRSGTFTFQTADSGGTPHNITLNSNLRGGSGALKKTGGGMLNLNGTNTYTGNTIINNGSLVLGSSASLASSKIIVGSGTTFDVSAVTGGFVLTNQTLSGSGVVTGAVSVASSATIDPGSNTLTGTLSFSNSVTEASGTFNHFDISGAPNPNNDLVIIAGDLNVSGTNTVDINGASLVARANYILIQYGGNLNGGITNFALSISSPNGALTNDATAKTISFVPQTVLRGPTNTVWIGNPVNTNWDNASSTNWLNASSGVLDSFGFVSGDSVQFTDAGASNSPVNIVGAVQPSSILVNSQSNYVFASTSGGWIGGAASLTVTNTGMLTIAVPTNTYTGNTTIDGGSTLVVAQVASAGLPSAIGEGNLIINNGTFSYTGSSSSVNLGATLGAASSVISVASGTLTLGGALTGPGALTKTGNGQLTLNGTGNYPGVTVITAGTIRGNPASAIGANTLTLNGGATAANFQFGGDAQTLNNVLNVVGTNNSITMSGNDTVSGITGSGKLNMEGTGANILTFQAADMTAFTGTVYWDGITTNRLFPSSGTTINAPSTTFDMGIGSGVLMNRDGGNYHLGALQSSSSSTQVRGSNNSGSAGTTYYIGEKGLDTTFAGVIRTGTGGTGATTSIVKLGADTFTLTGANTYTGSTTISNGVLALAFNGSTDGSINNSTTINVTPGTYLDVSARSDKTLQLGASATQQLRGRGTINGSLNVGGSGTVAPGGDIGTLTVTNNIYLNGTAWMKLNRTNSQTSDLLVSSLGAISYGGTLVVTNIGDPLQVGDTFTLFSPHGSGSFTLKLPITYIWDTSQLTVNGSITVTGIVAPPSISKIDYSQLANGSITFYGTYPNATNYPFGTFTGNVLTSTNMTSPLSSWKVIATGLIDDGTYAQPPGQLLDTENVTPYLIITVDPTLPKSFYLLQVQ